MSNNSVSVVIVSAGKGSRMNMSVNKQFIDINGIPLLAHTLSVFQRSIYISEIIIVANSDEIEYCKAEIVEKYEFTKVSFVVNGGTTRQSSVYNGISCVSQKSDIILIHDGARPFINDNILLNCINAVHDFGACTVAVPVKDTIKKASSSNFITDTLDRSLLWSIQTPQGFSKQIILNAHQKAIEDAYTGTDDAVLVERIGIKVKLVMGTYFNIKVTTQEDIIFANAIAKTMNF